MNDDKDEPHTVSDMDRRATYGRLGAAGPAEYPQLSVSDVAIRGDVVVVSGPITWPDEVRAAQQADAARCFLGLKESHRGRVGDINVSAGAVTWVDPMPDMAHPGGGTVWKTSLTGAWSEPQAGFAEEVIAWCRREAAKGETRKIFLKAKEEPDYSGVKPNIPRLKASDLLKAGVLCVPENDEVPDPEKVGTDLLVFGVIGDYAQWLHAKWDHASGEWVEKSDEHTVFDIECWMLPPALKE